MKVLVACEESQAVTIEFRKLGHEAYSCDIIDCSGGYPEWHLKQDVIPLLKEDWDLIIAFPPCFKEGTFVSTIEGLKDIKDIKEGDLVLTHLNRYRRVHCTYKTFSPSIKNIYFSGGILSATEEHPFLTLDKDGKEIWTKLKDLKAGDFLSTQICSPEHVGFEFDKFKLDFKSRDFWFIVGKYLGDGWNTIRKKKYKETNICTSKIKLSEREILTAKLKTVFQRFSIEEQKTTFRFVIRNNYFYDFLEYFGRYCENKLIPEFMFCIEQEFREAFLEGYFFADGYLNDKRQSFCTVSEKLAIGLQRLINITYQKNVSIRKTQRKESYIEGRLIKPKPIYDCYFSLKNSKKSKLINNKMWIQIDKIENTEHLDYVYNIAVEEDESYIANNIINHNCTDLAVSGARHFEAKRKDGRQQKSIDFFMEFTKAKCDKIAIENPIGIMSTLWRKPDQIIQPWEFGHGETKATCLWLKGLPLLIPTNIVDGREQRIWKLPPTADRAKLRSKTYPGIAKAMAEQWSE